MEFKNLVWGAQDSVDANKLQQLSINDELIYELGITNPHGILGFGYRTIPFITGRTISSHFLELGQYITKPGDESSPGVPFFVEKMRIVSFTLIIPKVNMIGGNPSPRFRFVVDDIEQASRTYANNILEESVLGNATVVFKDYRTDLLSGNHTLVATVFMYERTTTDQLSLDCNSTYPILLIATDEGSQRAYV